MSLVVDQLAMEGYLEIARGRRPTVAAAATAAAGIRRAQRRAGRAPVCAFRAGRSGCANPTGPSSMKANRGRFFPASPMRARFRTTSGRAVFDARPATRWLRIRPALNRRALQAALLRHLVEHRGVRAQARQIIVTPSAQSSIELIARVLLDPGDIAWLESPGYGGARAALEAAGADIRGVRLDRSGLAFKGRRDRPRLIFVTPSHQYPTGRLMPIHRRQELLAFADAAGAAIIEDDYDSEFHYDGRPVAALQGLDDSGNVFYVGTFSKSMFADVRTGYCIVPENLVDVFETGPAPQRPVRAGAAAGSAGRIHRPRSFRRAHPQDDADLSRTARPAGAGARRGLRRCIEDDAAGRRHAASRRTRFAAERRRDRSASGRTRRDVAAAVAAFYRRDRRARACSSALRPGPSRRSTPALRSSAA